MDSDSTIFDTGIIEGFFGKPWTHKNRLSIIEFIKEVGLGSYIYAPKEDPFHRKNWRALYPVESIKNFRKIINQCQALDLVFNFALSPGLSIQYSSESDFEKICRKYEQMIDLGVTAFSLLFDDIDPGLSKNDLNVFTSLAQAQTCIANKTYQYLKMKVPDLKFFFCPTEYRGTRGSAYLTYIGRHLLPEIKIFWTGPSVISKRITIRDARQISHIIRRKPVLWDNYPVNDYEPSRLFLGPLQGRDRKLLDHLSGIFFNPMNQAEASKIALTSCALYVRAPEVYFPERIWPLIKNCFSNSARGEIFFENFKPSILNPEESASTRIIKQGIATLRRKGKIDIYSLNKLADKINTVKLNLFPQNLRNDFEPFLKNLKDCARIIKLITKKYNGNQKRIKTLIARVRISKRKESRNYFENQVINLSQLVMKQNQKNHH